MDSNITMILYLLHNGASVGVLVAKKRHDHVVWSSRQRLRLLRLPHITGRSFFVVNSDCIWICHHVVRNVRPHLRLFPCPFDSLQHLLRLHVPAHRHFVYLPVQLHSFNPCAIIRLISMACFHKL